jgi:hypothetical protein
LLAALSVWGLRAWVAPPSTASQDFVYLCVICGTGTVVYFAVLAALRALPVTQLALLWPRGNGS